MTLFSVLQKFPRVPRYGLLPNTPVNNAEINLAEESCSAVSAISALWTWPIINIFLINWVYQSDILNLSTTNLIK